MRPQSPTVRENADLRAGKRAGRAAQMTEDEALAAFQTELDCASPPGDHLTSVRRMAHVFGGEACVCVCICGYFRYLATHRIACQVASRHQATGEEF